MRRTAYIITICIMALALLAGVVLLRAGVLAPPRAYAPEASPPPVPETAAPAPAPSPRPSPAQIPPASPSPEPTPEPEPEYFVLSFVGDCTLASSQHVSNSAERAFERVVGDDLAYPFAATKEYFENDYLSVANMEGTFTTAAASSGGTFTFKSDPSYAGIFTEGGIELVSLANNHSGDYLAQGLEDTKAALDAAGVRWADDGGRYLYQRPGGPKVGVYAKLYPTAGQVADGVRALKEEGAEIIVAALHWGIEGSYRPTWDQETVGHAAIDAGADIVYGSHPHVLQRVEEYGGGEIFYSLGNWSFGGHTAPRDRDTAILQVTFRRDPDGTLSRDGVEWIPCKLSGSDGWNDYQPQPYAPDSPEYARAVSKLDGSFAGPDLPVDYSVYHRSPAAAEPEEIPAGEAPGEGSGADEVPAAEAPGTTEAAAEGGLPPE